MNFDTNIIKIDSKMEKLWALKEVNQPILAAILNI